MWWRNRSIEMSIPWFLFLPYSVCTMCVSGIDTSRGCGGAGENSTASAAHGL